MTRACVCSAHQVDEDPLEGVLYKRADDPPPADAAGLLPWGARERKARESGGGYVDFRYAALPPPARDKAPDAAAAARPPMDACGAGGWCSSAAADALERASALWLLCAVFIACLGVVAYLPESALPTGKVRDLFGIVLAAFVSSVSVSHGTRRQREPAPSRRRLYRADDFNNSFHSA